MNKEGKIMDFNKTLELHLNSIKNKDLDAFM